MTIIAAICSDRRTIIGYNDGLERGGTPILGTSLPWIFFNDLAFGITGESSVQRLLSYKIREFAEIGSDPHVFIDAVRQILTDNYVGSKDDSDFVTTYGIYSILVHKDGRIWDVGGCLSLTEIPHDTLWAQGSGADYAMGAFHALESVKSKIATERKLKICIEAAIKNDIHCVGIASQRPWS